jgi:hypothetical protein
MMLFMDDGGISGSMWGCFVIKASFWRGVGKKVEINKIFPLMSRSGEGEQED